MQHAVRFNYCLVIEHIVSVLWSKMIIFSLCLVSVDKNKVHTHVCEG